MPGFVPYHMLVFDMGRWTYRRGSKVTIEIPEDLLAWAQKASGKGITETVRTGLQLVAAADTYKRVRELRGKVKFSCTLAELNDDR